jgi:hypothetical protein
MDKVYVVAGNKAQYEKFLSMNVEGYPKHKGSLCLSLLHVAG